MKKTFTFKNTVPGLFITIISFFAITLKGYGQDCTKAVNAPTTINGVYITGTGTGDYATSPLKEFTSCNGSVTTPANSLYLGGSGEFSYTYTFSKPVNYLTIAITGTGSTNGDKENFIFTTNATGTVSIRSGASCFSTITGNQIIAGAGSSANGGGGVFIISNSNPFTSLTIAGSGGASGSLLALCENSVVETCALSPVAPNLSATNKANVCPATMIDLSSITASNLPSGTTLTWHSGTPVTNANDLSKVTALAAGTYYAAFFDATNNCYSPASAVVATITNCCPYVYNIPSDNVNPSTCRGSNGSIKLCGLTGSSTGYTIHYDKNGTASTALTSQTADANGCITLTGLTAGSYTNIYVSSSGCPSGSYAPSATLTDPSGGVVSPSALSGSPNPGCTSVGVALTATGASGASYVWTVSPAGATFSSAAGVVSGTTASNSLNSTAPGVYTVSVTQTVGGCTSSSATTTITVNGSATAPWTTARTKSNVCPTTTVDLTSLQQPDQAGQSLEWHTVGRNPTSGDLVATPATAAAGTYYLYLYDKSTAGGCYSPASSAVVATVTSCCPTITTTASNNVNPSTCGGSNGSIKICGLVANTSGYTINYLKNGVAATALTSQTADANGCVTITGLTAGNYTSIKVSSNVCLGGNNALSATLTDPSGGGASPSALSGSPNPGCTGGAVALTATGASGASYVWTVSPAGATFSSAAGVVSGTTASNSLNSTAPGVYTVSVTQTVGGCTSSSATTTITVNGSATAPVPTASIKSNVCPATTVDLTSFQSASVAGQSYEWHTVGRNPTAGDLVASPTTAAAGTYYLYDKSTTGSCYSPASSAVVATVTSCCPTITTTASNNVNPSTCGGSNGSIKICGLVANTSGYTINYLKNGVAVTALTNQTSDGTGCIVLANLGAGSYTNIKVSSNACPSGSNALSATLTDPSGGGASPSALSGSPNPGCTSVTVALTATGASGASYVWTVSPAGATFSSAAGVVSGTTASNSLNSTAPGVYTVSVTQTVGGCTSSSATTTITVNGSATAPVPTASTKSNVCPTTTVDLTSFQSASVAGQSYEWHTVGRNPTAGDLVATPATAAAGTYYLYLYDKSTIGGCYSPASSAVVATVTSCCPTITTTASSNVNPSTCGGSNGSIKICGLVANTSGYTINYLKNGVTVTALTNQTSDGTGCIVLTNLGAGSYTNIKVSSNACPSGSNASSATLTDPASSTLTASDFTKTNPTTCKGTNGTIKICGLVASTSYSTSYNKNGLTQTSVVQTTDATGCLTLSTLSSGTYDNFIVTNTVTMCPSANGAVSLALSDPAGTTLTLGTSQNPSACGLNDGFIQIGGLAIGTQYTLEYSLTGASQTPITFTASAVNYTLSGLTAGNYANINVTSLGCISNSLTKSLSDPTTATTSLAAKTNPSVCSGNDGTFVVGGLVPNTSYVLLYTKDGVVQTPISFVPTGASYLVNGLVKGAYTNIRVSSTGCISNSLATTLNDPSAPVISSGGINNPSACGTANGSFSITGLVTGTTYTIKYKKNGIWQASINVPATSSSYTITGLAAGSYTNISVSNGDCISNSLSQQLVEPGAAVIALGTIKQPTLCGSTDGAVTITGLTSGLTYVLNYVKDGIVQTPASFVASGTSYTLTGLLIGNYTGINVNQGGCVSTSLVAVLSNPGAPIIEVTGLDTKTCSPGDEGGFIITSLSQGVAYTLNYMKNGIAQTPIPFNTNSISYKVNGLTAGIYSNITITQGSCISNPESTVINGPSTSPAPVLDKTSLSSVCPVNNSDLTTITASNTPAGYRLTWHTGTPATALNEVGDATSAGAGTYYGTFSNATTNCFGATSPVTVTVTPCSPDLTTTVGQPSPSPVAGQPSSIPVTVKNIGTASSTGPITALVQIPAGTTFGTFPTNNNGWSCTTSGTTATCTNSAILASGVSSSLQVPFIPTNAQVGNTLTVPPAKVSGGGEPDTNTGNNESNQIMTPAVATNGAPDLTTTITAPSTGLPNTPFNYTVHISNIGTQPSSGSVTESITIPAGLTFNSGGGSGFVCTPSIGPLAGPLTITCTNPAPNIPAGGNTSFPMNVTPTTSGILTITGNLSGGQDSNLSNNNAPPNTIQVGCGISAGVLSRN